MHKASRLPGGLRRSAKSLTPALVYRRAVGDGSTSNPLGNAVPIPGRHTSQRLRLGAKRAEWREPPGPRAARCA
jgi:hypothetical protein